MNAFIKGVTDNISTLLAIISAILAIYSVYNKIKSNLIKSISEFIKDAEGEANLTGSEKMNLVVGWCKNLIPRIFSVVFSEKVIEAIAQSIFSDMKKYTDSFIKNKTGMKTDKLIEVLSDDSESPMNTDKQ